MYPEKKIPIIIDCDTGIDDLLALLLAVQSPLLDILGATTTAGNQTIENTTRNTLDALEFLGRPDIPVAVGRDRPLYRNVLAQGSIHGANGVGGYRFPAAKRTPDHRAAPEFVRDLLAACPDKVTLVALAPLTNIAVLLEKYPACKERIDKILFMGGSIATGNPTPVATANVWYDPEAARAVIASGIPVVMCSLNCSRGAYLTKAELAKVRGVGGPAAAMADEVLKAYYATTGGQNPRGLNIHDLCTMMYLTDPGMFTGDWYFVDVECKGELTCGMTVVDYEDRLHKPREEKTVYFLKTADRNRFADNFFRALKSYS